MKSRTRWLILGLGLVVLLVVPFPVASRLEERDEFCISCHTAPEETYYERAVSTAAGETAYPPDLASAHYDLEEMPFRCIDCHRGDQSFPHRLQTFLLGARDALIWASGQADETIEKVHAGEPELLNAGCLHCHAEAVLELGFNNHYHNQLTAARKLEAMGLEPFAPSWILPAPAWTATRRTVRSRTAI